MEQHSFHFIWSCICPSDEFNLFFFFSFCSLPSPETNIWIYSCWILHCFQHLVANSVCLQFGAKVVYSGYLELFLWKQLSAVAKNNVMRAVRVNQNSKCVARQLNKELKLAIKFCQAERSGGEDNFSVHAVTWYIIVIKDKLQLLKALQVF